MYFHTMGKARYIFERQWLNYLLLAGLLSLIWLVSVAERLFDGELFDLPTFLWFWIAIASAVIHQMYVWFVWRTQLHLSLITKLFGENGFDIYAVGFAILGILRFFVIIIVALANSKTLEIDRNILNLIGLLFLIPSGYLFYSVVRYFSVKRAMGIDHFDESYRTKPFVRKGIFRYTSNGMYTYGFLLIWLPGLVFASKAALLAAAFHHAYIWVHYYCTEQPDIKRIYH